MSGPIFVCYFTPSYRAHALGLVESLRAHDLEHAVCEVVDHGSWQRNCQRKPAFLRAMLAAQRRPVVWIDADARVRTRPDVLLDMPRGVDVAVHNYGLSGGREEVLSGTVYLAYSAPALTLLESWQARCVERPHAYDQQCLQDALSGGWGGERMQLPAEYCFIFDVFRAPFYRRNHPEVGEPVIEHLQHSRVVRAAERGASCQSG